MLHNRLHINTFFQKDKRAIPGNIRIKHCSISCSHSGVAENVGVWVNGDVFLGVSTRIFRQFVPEDANTAILS